MPDYTAHVVLGESLTPVGRLRFTRARPRQFSTFAYEAAWIENPRAFAVQPSLPLEGGPFHTAGQPGNMRDALAGVFADAVPDSWGRRLLERAYGAGLCEFEYLTLSDDVCRQGALRFLDDAGKVIRGAASAVPRLIDLQAITAIARAYEQGRDISTEDMQALAGAGGSGGARPKANVRDGDTLWLAKFTSVYDQHPIERVEVATLRLARACGIRTPEVRLELADTRFPVALIQRFDRRGTARIPYISARTALGKMGTELGSYTEIVDFMRGAAADPQADFRELFLRLIFTILVSNKDDHLKNHGFLYVGSGRWRLSPVFDVNPAPDRNPHLETAILEGGAHDRSIRLALDACAFFEITEADARHIIREQRSVFLMNGVKRCGLSVFQAALRATTNRPSSTIKPRSLWVSNGGSPRPRARKPDSAVDWDNRGDIRSRAATSRQAPAQVGLRRCGPAPYPPADMPNRDRRARNSTSTESS